MSGSGTIGDLVVAFKADTSGLQSGVAQAQNVLQSLASNPLAAIGVGLGVATAAAIGLGIATSKMAGDYESGITTLATGAGESTKNLKMVSDGILAMAPPVGATTKALTDGMYLIESAGYHGAAGLTVLQDAAEGAKVGNADLAAVADGVTTAMTDYASSGLTAAQATNTMIATVAAGKTNMNDLASSMASILPTAAAVRVKFVDVSGAMATMTGEGTPAADAATYLRQMLMALENPAAKGAKALAQIGLTSAQVSDEMKTSLPDTIQMITDALGKKFPPGSAAYVKALSDIAGGSKQMQGMLELSGEHLAVFQGNVATISGAVEQAGSSISGWSLVQGNFNQKMDEARAAVEVLGIKVGTALLPTLTPLVGQLTPIISQFTNWLANSGALTTGIAGLVSVVSSLMTGIAAVVTADASVVSFFQQNQVAAVALLVPLGALGGYFVFLGVSAIASFIAAAPVMIAGFIAGAAAAWTMAAGVIAATWPFLLIGAAIGLVVALVILAVTHWGQITEFLKTVWGRIAGFFTGLWAQITAGLTSFVGWLGGVWNGLMSFLGNAVKVGMQVVLAVFLAPIYAIVTLFDWLYTHNYYFKNLVDSITNVTKAGLAWLQGAWQAASSWLSGAWQGISSHAQSAWQATSSTIQQKSQETGSWLQTHWTSSSNWLQTTWNRFASFMGTAWKTVSDVISGAWNTSIAQPLQKIWDGFVNWYGHLALQFYNSGVNFISMLVNGIASGAGAIWNEVSNIAGTIWKALGFHSPPKGGPLADADTYMPNFVTMLTQGLNAGVPKMQTAVTQFAQPLTMLSPASTASIASSTAPMVAASAAQGQGQTVVPLQIDARAFATLILPYLGPVMGQYARLQTGYKGAL